MGWATPVYVAAQVEYRLTEQCGHDEDLEEDLVLPTADLPVPAPGGDLRWAGDGLAEVGLVPGRPVDPAAARLLMDGRHPGTGERLVVRKRHVHPAAKLPAAPLAAAVTEAARAAGGSAEELLRTVKVVARFARATRGLARDDGHALPVTDADTIAAAAGLALEDLYEAGELERARRASGWRIEVGLRGVDVVLDLPKSISLAYALADPATAAIIEASWLEAVGEAVDALQTWCAYGMAGHHGGGRTARRVETSGLLGWTVLHRTARPVPDPSGRPHPGDPHLHVHICLAHLARGTDGKWRTIAAGGKDLHRHARAANELAEARLREKLITRLGARFTREPGEAWELDGIPPGCARPSPAATSRCAWPPDPAPPPACARPPPCAPPAPSPPR
ncbi:MobF family relaxase [Streptomyces aidingensis]|uniref:TrwC relaxase n=1 Tax=Streptomyces aidingensis TaxID=910347 RepID=A0A1I1V414_9ACTN|nr:MobF family relaxase [Streptomyces aidingensis]SFD75040.1 TrwC relaxase [Streptomyces aidingensis]